MESAFQKTFLPCKIKNENCAYNYKAATKDSSPKSFVHKINNKTRKILEKHAQRIPLPSKQLAERL